MYVLFGAAIAYLIYAGIVVHFFNMIEKEKKNVNRK